MRPSARALVCMRANFALRASTLAVGLFVSLSGCGSNGFVTTNDQPKKAEAIALLPVPTPAPQNDELAICSNLSLTGVVWPLALDLGGKRALALALNISGSFEGASGWKNLTNSFDGQGLSLGLLNQCLGQDSLQPLVIKIRDRSPTILRDIFSSSHLASLNSMLSTWQSTVKVANVVIDRFTNGEVGETSQDGLDGLRLDGRLSDLDLLPDGSDGVGQQESASGDSVTWAKQNLYTDGGTTFQAAWKKELQAMSGNPAYVSVQIEASLSLHSNAVAYMKSLGLHQLRSFLFLFDVNVQNGGLYTADITAYKAAFPDGSTADETTRLKKILALRLAHVVTKYKSDVQARKLSIINGVGAVHGTARDYSKEYCFNDKQKIL